MLYVKIENGKAVSATQEYPGNKVVNSFETRNDWRTFERAEQVADELSATLGNTAMYPCSRPFIAIDNGDYVSPRFDVIERPRLGEECSYSFNGDTYPDGKIVKVSGANFRIVTTDTGSVYYRRKLSGSWIKKGGTWGLVKGHRNERNPSY